MKTTTPHLTPRWLPVALAIVAVATGAAQAAQAPRPLKQPEAARATAVASTFFNLLRTPTPKKVDAAFRQRYFTKAFSTNEYVDEMAGSLVPSQLKLHAPMVISPGNAIVKGDYSHGKYHISYVLFLKKEPTWKVVTLRTLAIPGFIRQMDEELAAKPNPTADEKRRLRESKRLYLSDEEMKARFLAKKALFEAAARRFKGKPQPYKLDAATLSRLDVAGAGLMYQWGGNVDFSLGGILDNTLGYIYAPKDDVPPVTESEYFYIEKIAPHWYIYRTT